MDIVGFALLGSVTGIGGGSVRDVLPGTLPVFWVEQPAYLITCILLSCGAFFFVHLVCSRLLFLIWCDAVGLALFSVSGASIAIAAGTAPTIAIAMGVVTATFGGIIRDILGGEVPIILSREIYVTAALLGAAVLVVCQQLALSLNVSMISGFVAALVLRAAAIIYDVSLPVFRKTDTDDIG